ncbi:MAG: FtsW/RodA/SpoVE family cell cycle protein, partial [Planctomycetota bacterium]
MPQAAATPNKTAWTTPTPAWLGANPGSTVVIIATALAVLGVVMVFSSSGQLDRPFIPFVSPWSSAAVKQCVFAVGGVALMWLTWTTSPHMWRWRLRGDGNRPRSVWLQPSALFLVLTLALLALTLIPGMGAARNGARRWVQLGAGLGFQPSELAKLSLVILLAAWLPTRQGVMGRFRRGLLPAAMIVGITAALIIKEDLGTAALISIVGGLMILAAGGRAGQALALVMPAAIGFAAMIYCVDYRWERVTSFLDVWDDVRDTDYHAVQSLVGIAGGGFAGQGLGAGVQKYGYLPEIHNDFIFAALCEELGMLGGAAVLGLFVCLCIAGFRIQQQAPDLHTRLLAFGLTTIIGMQAIMNV